MILSFYKVSIYTTVKPRFTVPLDLACPSILRALFIRPIRSGKPELYCIMLDEFDVTSLQHPGE